MTIAESIIDQLNSNDKVVKRALRVARESLAEAWAKSLDDAFMTGDWIKCSDGEYEVPSGIMSEQMTIDAEYEVVDK
jgi:hypothetical protein